MTEEYIYEREQDVLDYFRNNLEDPSSRSTTVTNESHTGSGGQKIFTLDNTSVRNVRDTITVGGFTKRKGYDYTVQYGEGSNLTTITLESGTGAELLITYDYGPSMIEKEFSRSDVKLPRMVFMFLTGSEDPAGLGDELEEGSKGSYFNVSYRVEIRDRYATRARQLASKAFNLGQKMRHANIFRTNGTNSTDLQNFDFDPDKNAYVWQFTFNAQWEIMFE